MQKFATTAPITAILAIPAGRVQIVAADQSHTTVAVKAADASKSRDVKAAEQTAVTFDDGVLRIEAAPAGNQYFGSSGALDVTVELPAGSRIDAKSASTEFRTVGRLGDVAFDGAHGTVELEETAGLRLTVHAADVSVGRLAGNSEIRVSSGDITIAEAQHGTLELRTESGRITVGAAHGASATLDAGTSHGRIHNALTNTEGAAAALNIHATTASGDITARSL
ncbi:hypothetical protein GCM10010331_24050 [Streptomyces xanthochromogenes]|uniref:DUF4097 family beta strand repeat-containing protein n=1 Tax=Streptomyces xanthochromogenes TaxID=67384 RepID=UPI001677EC67|nr:DUF4097 family beta strand repeat-containing protein [Streptomyces xanthochromogenes]GHB35853.1 hypothetical protein GCM10010331_24050 [Streptomyces xanthochromogenes]